MLKLYNTLSKKIEDFIPLKPPAVSLYTCGPTVYDYSHIGHLRKYTGDDLLVRAAKANNFNIKHVQNITDVGHLTSDADEGDDKLDKKAKERNQTVWETARFFETYHFNSTDRLNILRPDVIARATEHITEQIKLIEKLEKKGFVYITDQAIYFDTSKFPNYGMLSGQKLSEKNVGVRPEVHIDPQKKHPADFSVWFFLVGHFKDHVMHWSSPWGEGFPGWHIECSAMSMEYLGDTIDIHTGGIDHIPVHHTNEIAQSEAATGKQFVKYWIHHEFLLVDGEKMSKSKKNYYNIDDLLKRNFDPLSLRYLFLTVHYRDSLNFTWESLTAAQNALNNIRKEISTYDKPNGQTSNFYQKFFDGINLDLNLPQALSFMHKMIKSNLPSFQKAQDILEMDKILGLNLSDYLAKPFNIPPEVQNLVKLREDARKKGDFNVSDKIRLKIKKLGYEIDDTPDGPRITPL